MNQGAAPDNKEAAQETTQPHYGGEQNQESDKKTTKND